MECSPIVFLQATTWAMVGYLMAVYGIDTLGRFFSQNDLYRAKQYNNLAQPVKQTKTL